MMNGLNPIKHLKAFPNTKSVALVEDILSKHEWLSPSRISRLAHLNIDTIHNVIAFLEAHNKIIKISSHDRSLIKIKVPAETAGLDAHPKDLEANAPA